MSGVFLLLLLPGLGLWCYHGAPSGGCVHVCHTHPSKVQGLELGDLGEDLLVVVVVVGLGGLHGVLVEGESDKLSWRERVISLGSPESLSASSSSMMLLPWR